MKKFILPVLVCFAVSTVKAHAAEGGMPVRKSSPIIRNILSDRLPARLQKSIRKQYGTYWITGLYKAELNGRTSYHITVENPDQIVKLSATASTKWSVNRVTPKLEF